MNFCNLNIAVIKIRWAKKMTVINSRNTKKRNGSELYGNQQIKKQIQCQEKNSLATENKEQVLQGITP